MLGRVDEKAIYPTLPTLIYLVDLGRPKNALPEKVEVESTLPRVYVDNDGYKMIEKNEN